MFIRRTGVRIASLVALLLSLALIPTLRGEEASSSTPLHKEMEAVNKDLQKLTRQVKDASKNAASLTLIQDMQQHTLAAKAIPPENLAATRPAEVRQKYLEEYRRQMIDVLKSELDLERQVLDGKNDQAQQTIKSLRELEHKGHKDYHPPEND